MASAVTCQVRIRQSMSSLARGPRTGISYLGTAVVTGKNDDVESRHDEWETGGVRGVLSQNVRIKKIARMKKERINIRSGGGEMQASPAPTPESLPALAETG